MFHLTQSLILFTALLMRVSRYQWHHDGDIEMNFTDTVNPNVNVVFLCLGHGKSIQFLEQNQFASHTKIIDLGNDFRLTKTRV
jgi:N-acetyl-gamma-glutamyl-phosphate reductase